MNIAVVGNDIALAECKAKFGDGHDYHPIANASVEWHIQPIVDIIFDFNVDWSDERLTQYTKRQGAPIFLNSIFTTLSSLFDKRALSTSIFGFCGLPTFFNRSILEITTANHANADLLNQPMTALKTEFKIVKDQVGMVTPRVVCMIINEAFEALQQGVASREDIDLAMKLGTNYPFGPFEWGERIGLENVKRILKALEKSSGDRKYHSHF